MDELADIVAEKQRAYRELAKVQEDYWAAVYNESRLFPIRTVPHVREDYALAVAKVKLLAVKCTEAYSVAAKAEDALHDYIQEHRLAEVDETKPWACQDFEYESKRDEWRTRPNDD